MSDIVPTDHLVSEKPRSGALFALGRIFHGIENGIIVLALAAMILLPLIEMILRKTPLIGVTGSTAFVQHGCLILAMVGGAIAARENRVLSLATTQMLPPGWILFTARILSGSIGGVISAMLCVASVRFILDEYLVGKVLAYGIPYWTFQLALPIGFFLIALRLLWHSADRWRAKIISLTVAVTASAFCIWPPFEQEELVIPAMIVLLLATVLGGAIFVVLGGAALILFWGDYTPIASVSVDHYRLVTNPSLPAIPLFTMAGYFLAEGGASKRLVRVFSALFGPVRGGSAIVTVVVCAFFTTFTGASGVTILALGGLLMPVLLAARYSERNALGLLTGAGSLGLLFPPCLPLILCAIVAEIPVKTIFVAALLPGVILLVLTGSLGIWQGPREAAARPKFSETEAAAAIWRAKWELLLPVVALSALFGGFATPVEAAAITAFYAFATQTLISRDLRIMRDVPRVMTECGLVIGGVLLILGVAQGFTNYLIFAEVPARAVEWAEASINSPLVFLLLLNLFLLIVGCVMDIFSAIIVVLPLLLPIGQVFNIPEVHLAIIFLANLELGFLTPPVGMNLFLASYRFGKPVPEVCRSIIPILLVQIIGVLLITYVSACTLSLPRLFNLL